MNIYKVSTGTTMLFESVDKNEATTFAQRYYSKTKTIPDICEFRRSPTDHSK